MLNNQKFARHRFAALIFFLHIYMREVCERKKNEKNPHLCGSKQSRHGETNRVIEEKALFL